MKKANRKVMRQELLPKGWVLTQGRVYSRMSDNSILFAKGIIMEQPNNKLINAIILLLTMVILFTSLPIYADMVQSIHEFLLNLTK